MERNEVKERHPGLRKQGSAERLTEVPALRLRGEAARGDRARAAGQDVAQGKNLPPSPEGYRMHISRFGLSAVCPLALLRGPLPPPALAEAGVVPAKAGTHP